MTCIEALGQGQEVLSEIPDHSMGSAHGIKTAQPRQHRHRGGPIALHVPAGRDQLGNLGGGRLLVLGREAEGDEREQQRRGGTSSGS